MESKIIDLSFSSNTATSSSSLETQTQIQEGSQVFDIHEKRNKTCEGGCGREGRWRFCTQTFVCNDCRAHHPAHKLICRSTAKGRYHLTYQQLFDAFKRKEITMFTVKNPRGGAPCRLYYEYEIFALTKRLQQQEQEQNAAQH